MNDQLQARSIVGAIACWTLPVLIDYAMMTIIFVTGAAAQHQLRAFAGKCI